MGSRVEESDGDERDVDACQGGHELGDEGFDFGKNRGVEVDGGRRVALLDLCGYDTGVGYEGAVREGDCGGGVQCALFGGWNAVRGCVRTLGRVTGQTLLQ